MKKRISMISFVAVLCLVFGSVSAFAASFSFHFTPPFVGSLKSTSTQKVTTLAAAYVNPSTSATPTSYFLSPTPGSSTNATNIITDISTSGSRSLTYNSGYGGMGTSLCLSGYPSNFDFVDYNIAGTWSP
ncbi:hypothetical protein [Paenibacillus eucommiae]|uniref:Uncharacterized protein n=1 Tax=Paenibacillus eucommiae TaxID=1355755 RepID=A0ABS4J3A6_9BACL|nr:hypothetical protein [Paenibacillus eucommiae]MBP1994325.1 hypothetical protein [Paenibacillus eucommiae]